MSKQKSSEITPKICGGKITPLFWCVSSLFKCTLFILLVGSSYRGTYMDWSNQRVVTEIDMVFSMSDYMSMLQVITKNTICYEFSVASM